MTLGDRGDPPVTIYDTLRRIEQENAALRRKLARHEFRQLERELSADRPFDMDVRPAAVPVPVAVRVPVPVGLPVSATEDVVLPRLPVPLGSIIADDVAGDLPIIGVHDDGLTGQRLAAALLGLMKTQYRAPFARLVFLCTSAEAVPLLGRYGFVAELVGAASPAEVLPRLHQRYGVGQIRALGSGEMLAERNEG